MSISRRGFLKTTAIGGVAVGSITAAEPVMPTRMLGKTGVKVSILAFGGGNRFTEGYKEEDQASAILQRAFDLGINYIDTSDSYGVSQKRCGLALKSHGRKGIFVATKITTRDGSEFNRTLERGLKDLAIDRLDLLHIHALGDDADLARIEARGGVLEQLQKAKEQKVTRFIGITCHGTPLTLKKALERHDFDCTQMSLNAAQAGAGDPLPMTASFQNTALPVAVAKNLGVMAMKVWLHDLLPDVPERTARSLMFYTLSLPVAGAVIGNFKREYLEENARLAKAFKPLPAEEMRRLAAAFSKRKVALDNFFRHHIDA